MLLTCSEHLSRASYSLPSCLCVCIYLVRSTKGVKKKLNFPSVALIKSISSSLLFNPTGRLCGCHLHSLLTCWSSNYIFHPSVTLFSLSRQMIHVNKHNCKYFWDRSDYSKKKKWFTGLLISPAKGSRGSPPSAA